MPFPLTPLVGREQEISLAVDLLRRDDVRLLTITGPGGIGKTRLAIELGRSDVIRSERNVAFVPLAAVTDANLIPAEIARTLGLSEIIGVAARDSVVAALRDTSTVVILDNFEHVLPAAPILTGILAACPQLKIVTTSRALLRVAGEYALPMPPLPVPDPDTVPVSADHAAASPAMRLFVERVRASSPGFLLTADNAPVVAEICRHLDGLPLAIELAAAQAVVLPPTALLARIRSRLPLPVTGPRDAPARLRSLRETVAWSYDLLSPEEQRLFHRVAIFADGFGLDAVDAIHSRLEITTDPDADGADTPAPIEVIASLVEKSLLGQTEWEGEARFRMLQTIRTFALDQLAASGEVEAVGNAHAAWVLSLAASVELAPSLLGLNQTRLLRRLEVEHANLLAALSWLEQRGDVQRLLHLTAALSGYWHIQGHFKEGRERLERALVRAEDLIEPARGHAQVGLGFLLILFGEVDEADRLVTAAIPVLQDPEDAPVLALAYIRQASAANHLGQYDRGERLLQNALDLASGIPETALASALTGAVLANLGVVAHGRGDLDLAHERLREALRLSRARGYTLGTIRCLRDLGDVDRDRGDFVSALAWYRECLELFGDRGDLFIVVDALEGAALAAAAWGLPHRAARLLGAAEAFRELRAGVFLVPTDVQAHQRAVAALRSALDDAAITSAWAGGRELTLTDAIAEIRDLAPPDSARRPIESSAPVLSPRETVVLHHLAAGQPDREIAEALFLSVRTVEAHVARILAKLGVRSRTAAISAAIAAGLISTPSPPQSLGAPD